MVCISEMYVLKSDKNKTVYSQHFNAIMHQIELQRMIMFEVRINWEFKGKKLIETRLSLVGKKIFITKDFHFTHETYCSSLTDENLMIKGMAINFELNQKLVTLEIPNISDESDNYKTINNKFT